MRARLNAALAHQAEVEDRIAAGSVPRYQAAERRAKAAARVKLCQRRYDTTRRGIEERIARLKADPEKDSETRDPERQAILDDLLDYQRQLAQHRKGGQMTGTERAESDDEVLAGLSHDPETGVWEGGFTHDFGRGMTPTVGFMVSLPGHEAQVRVMGKTNREIRRLVRRYHGRKRALLEQPGNYTGGWINPDNGVLYLDVSRVETTVAAARQAAVEAQQEAFWDAQCSDEVFVLRGISETRENEGEMA
jgi:hypothetical protein